MKFLSRAAERERDIVVDMLGLVHNISLCVATGSQCKTNTNADVDAGIEFSSIPASTYSFTLTSSRNATQTKYCEPGFS